MTRRRRDVDRPRAPLAVGHYSTDPADHPTEHPDGQRPNPQLITLALDAAGPLEGPEVDEACAASEPDVDRWELGELEPTPYQLALLANLTGCTREFFYGPDEPPLSGGWACFRTRHQGSRCHPLPTEIVSPALADRRRRAARSGQPLPAPSGGTQAALF